MSDDQYAMMMGEWDGVIPDCKEELKNFTEEVIKEDFKWVSKCRCEYLVGKLLKTYREAFSWLIGWSEYQWLNELITENVNSLMKKAEKIEKEINLYQNPVSINYDNQITDLDIERARSVDCSLLLEVKTIKSGKNWAACPFHHDTHPSLLCYPEGRGFYCFACKTGGDAIDLVMKLYNYSFKESVEFLRRY